MNKRVNILVAAGVVLALGIAVLAGTALAQGAQGSKPQDSFISKVARILGIDEQRVRNAVVGAKKEMVDEAVQAGKLSQENADRLKEKIDGGDFGRGFFDRHGFKEGRSGKHGPGGMIADKSEIVKAVADAVGIAPDKLVDELRAGKSLAEIGQENGKSREDIKASLRSALTSRLDMMVERGAIARDKADQILSKFDSRIDTLLDKKCPGEKGQGSRGKGQD